MNPYAYDPHHDGCDISLIEDSAAIRRYAVSFPSAMPTKLIGNTPVRGEYILPVKAHHSPLVILVHGMGAKGDIPCQQLAGSLAAEGYACFVLYLIFHRARITEELKNKYPGLSAEEWFESYRVSVTDIRQLLDWARTRPEIDRGRIALTGISYGGFVSTIAMGLDQRIKAGVLVITGGNSEQISQHSLLLRWKQKKSAAEFKRRQSIYHQYLRTVASNGLDNTPVPEDSYLVDPLTFAGKLRGRPLLMVNAAWDELIPRASTIDLWEGCGKPPICWYPATHASIWIWRAWITRRIHSFLRTALPANLD